MAAPSRPQSLVHEWLERDCTLVVCQNDKPPTSDEWTGYLAELRRRAPIEHRVLLYTEIHLTRAQQIELKDATQSQVTPRVAVISPSSAVRFVTSIFTLHNRMIRCFSPPQYTTALEHLALGPEETESVTQCYGRLMKSVRVNGGVQDTTRRLRTR